MATTPELQHGAVIVMLISKKVRSLPSMGSFIITLKFERIHVVVNESALVGAPLLLGLLVAEILTPHLQHSNRLTAGVPYSAACTVQEAHQTKVHV